MSDAGIDAYIKDNQALFSDKGFAELLTELCQRHPIAKNALALVLVLTLAACGSGGRPQ